MAQLASEVKLADAATNETWRADPSGCPEQGLALDLQGTSV